MFAIALIVWAFELAGMPRDWFYRSSIYAAAGGTMLSLNALSGAAYHYELFGEDSNPGVFLYAAFFTFYVLDYFIFERVQLYTYDLIHENLGFKLFWGGLVVYGWLFILPLWGMAAYPDPGLPFRVLSCPAGASRE